MSLTAPELLKAEMPLVRYVERELTQHGVKRTDPDYDKKFEMAIKFHRQFSNIDLIKKTS